MPSVSKKIFSIKYLIALYTNEPTLRDLFVEGIGDVAIIDEFAKGLHLHRLKVRSIENVDVPEHIVKSEYGSGNRGMVVALAFALSSAVPQNFRNVYCIADNDLDRSLGIALSCDRLWWTDFSCMEAYLFTGEFFQLFVPTYFGVPCNESTFAEVCDVASVLFKIRVARVHIDPSAPWVSPGRSLFENDGKVGIDVEDYFDRMLVSKGRKSMVPRFREELSKDNSHEGLDRRCVMHKDDFFEVVCWMAKQRGAIADLCRVDVLARVVLSHLFPERIANFPLFRQIVDWASGASNS
jgi:hypothetical protein